MPKIWISTDEWYPWFYHADATENDTYGTEVSEEDLARLDQLASYVHEYQTKLAKLSEYKYEY